MREKKKVTGKFIAMLLAVVMVFTVLPSNIYAAEAPAGYTANAYMAYKVSGNTINVQGYYKDNWISTTYSAYSDRGYEVIPLNLENATVTATSSFTANGRFVVMTYTVSTNDESVSGRLGVYADVQIGDNDLATVKLVEENGKAVAFQMTDDHDNNCNSQDACLRLYFDGEALGSTQGCDTYCMGAECEYEILQAFMTIDEYYKETRFGDNFNPDKSEFSNEDSALAFSWNVNLDAHSSKEYKVMIGVGTQEELDAAANVNVKANYQTETLDNFETGTYTITADGQTYTFILNGGTTSIPLEGTDTKGQKYNFIGKTIKVKKDTSGSQQESEEKTITIENRPETPEAFEITNSDIVKTADSLMITLKNVDPEQEYVLVPEGTELTEAIWNNAKKTEGSDIQFTEDSKNQSLDQSVKYVIYTRKQATDNAPASLPSMASDKVSFHSHVWNYEVENNVITAKCTPEEDCEYHAEGLTFTLTADDCVFSGNSYEAGIVNHISPVTEESAWITYIGRGETVYEESQEAPKNAGTYTVKASIGGKTVTADFTILQKELTADMVEMDVDRFDYDNNEHGPAVAVKDASKELVKDTDYEIAGDTSKKERGNYILKVTGKGNYTGSVNKNWKISWKLIPDAEVTETNYAGSYDGKPHSATVNCNIEGAKITYRKSETEAYSENIPEYTIAGTYQVYYKIEIDGYETKMGTLTVTIPAGTVHNVTVSAGGHGNASASVSEAGYGSEIALTATPDSGYRLKGWTIVNGGNIDIRNNRFVMPDEDVELKAEFERIPSSSGTTKPAGNKENYTISIKNEDAVKVNATITDGKAEIAEITQDTIQSVMNHPDKESKIETITIDLSGATQNVTSVSLTKNSLKTITDAVNDKDNGINSATIELSNATVTLDAKTLETLSTEAKGSQIELVVKATKQTTLNAEQQEALNQYQVASTFEAYFVSDGERIHDFKGGNTVVAVKFTPEAGKDVSYYHMIYVAEDGTITYYKTRYKNGKIQFTTTHFSDYAIIYDESEKNDTETGKDETVKVDDSYAALRLAVTKSTKHSNILKWVAYPDADGYVVYGNKCNAKGKTYKLVKLATVKGNKTTWTNTELTKGTYYKYYVKAYKLVDGKKVWIAKSKVVHATTNGGKYGNPKAVKVDKTKITLQVGKSSVLKAVQMKDKLPIKLHTQVKFESTDKTVVTVNSKGVVKAKKKGTAYIYAYAQNGSCKKIKVVVK